MTCIKSTPYSQLVDPMYVDRVLRDNDVLTVFKDSNNQLWMVSTNGTIAPQPDWEMYRCYKSHGTYIATW